MTVNAVRIIAPSRIHFGLLSLGGTGGRRFGGAGVVVDRPPLILKMSRTSPTQVAGPLARRTEGFLQAWSDHTGQVAQVACEIVEAPDEHCGLGVGTQLGMSVALGLDLLFNRADTSLELRARSVNRGLRSAVGAYGFQQGGLIVEEGKALDDTLGRLRERVALPREWRLVLVRLRGLRGLAGVEEKSAFATLRVPRKLQSRLREELFERLVPAARRGDFAAFSESVFQYGIAAGECFSALQGGPFLCKAIARLVGYFREQGIAGVGQSSWGPTVYGWFPNEQSAASFQQTLEAQPNFDGETIVTSVCQAGAKVEFSR